MDPKSSVSKTPSYEIDDNIRRRSVSFFSSKTRSEIDDNIRRRSLSLSPSTSNCCDDTGSFSQSASPSTPVLANTTNPNMVPPTGMGHHRRTSAQKGKVLCFADGSSPTAAYSDYQTPAKAPSTYATTKSVSMSVKKKNGTIHTIDNVSPGTATKIRKEDQEQEREDMRLQFEQNRQDSKLAFEQEQKKADMELEREMKKAGAEQKKADMELEREMKKAEAEQKKADMELEREMKKAEVEHERQMEVSLKEISDLAFIFADRGYANGDLDACYDMALKQWERKGKMSRTQMKERSEARLEINEKIFKQRVEQQRKLLKLDRENDQGMGKLTTAVNVNGDGKSVDKVSSTTEVAEGLGASNVSVSTAEKVTKDNTVAAVPTKKAVVPTKKVPKKTKDSTVAAVPTKNAVLPTKKVPKKTKDNTVAALPTKKAALPTKKVPKKMRRAAGRYNQDYGSIRCSVNGYPSSGDLAKQGIFSTCSKGGKFVPVHSCRDDCKEYTKDMVYECTCATKGSHYRPRFRLGLTAAAKANRDSNNESL